VKSETSQSAAHAFGTQLLNSLSVASRRQLTDIIKCAEAQPPEGMLTFWLASEASITPQRLGLLSPDRATLLAPLLAGCFLQVGGQNPGLHWQALELPPRDRSALLQTALQACQARGWVHGWREEAFAFWDHDCMTPPDDGRPPALVVERAGFRFLGMRSHAVHINGFTQDGRLWVGRRSSTKATDPGLLDNVTAGGLPAGETPLECAQRELREEAGAVVRDLHALQACGSVRTARMDIGGWHDESLLVYNWLCPVDWIPHNQDGEVSEFACSSPRETLERILAGEFTHDAVASLMRGIGLDLALGCP
jgi:8-oxo-dGTP pyrophosphatase MutT (NUDIX family)